MALVIIDESGAQATLADWAQRDRAAALRLFVAAAREAAASARLALGYALRESLWLGSDSTVNEAKSGWWVEELALSERGAARHPLTRLLAQEKTRVDFSALARTLSGLRTSMPESGDGRILLHVSELESALWFGPGLADRDACAIRARACLVDVLERRSPFSPEGETTRRAIDSHAGALRAAVASDAWTAARRAQALAWVESIGSPQAVTRRWREVWTIWRAVRKTSRRAADHNAEGGHRGT